MHAHANVVLRKSPPLAPCDRKLHAYNLIHAHAKAACPPDTGPGVMPIKNYTPVHPWHRHNPTETPSFTGALCRIWLLLKVSGKDTPLFTCVLEVRQQDPSPAAQPQKILRRVKRHSLCGGSNAAVQLGVMGTADQSDAALTLVLLRPHSEELQEARQVFPTMA